MGTILVFSGHIISMRTCCRHILELNVHRKCTSTSMQVHFCNVETNLKPAKNQMETKKPRFSPSTFEEVERTTIARLVGTEDRYVAPLEYRGRVSSTWDLLVAAFPVPENVNVVSYVQRNGLARPMYDCFLPPSFNCTCYKCHTMLYPDIQYFHQVMESQDIEGSDNESKIVIQTIPGIDVNNVMDNVMNSIEHVAHFYTTYVFVPGFATYDEPPSTPTFSRVKFSLPDSPEEELKRKWVRRMRIVPTRLIF